MTCAYTLSVVSTFACPISCAMTLGAYPLLTLERRRGRQQRVHPVMALPHLGTLPFDHLARRRGQHAIEGFLVGREGAAFAALGFTDDRRIVVPAHGIFERHPASVQSAGKTPL